MTSFPTTEVWAQMQNRETNAGEGVPFPRKPGEKYQFLGRGLVGLGVEETGDRVRVERPRDTSRGQDFRGGPGASPGAGAEEAGARDSRFGSVCSELRSLQEEERVVPGP